MRIVLNILACYVKVKSELWKAAKDFNKMRIRKIESKSKGARDEQRLLKSVAARQEKELDRWLLLLSSFCLWPLKSSKFGAVPTQAWINLDLHLPRFTMEPRLILIFVKVHHGRRASSDPVRPQWGACSSQDQDEKGAKKQKAGQKEKKQKMAKKTEKRQKDKKKLGSS